MLWLTTSVVSGVSVSGGNANTQFLLGGGYANQTTVFPQNFYNRKVSARISMNHNSEDHTFNVNFSASYLSDVNQLPQVDLMPQAVALSRAPSYAAVASRRRCSCRRPRVTAASCGWRPWPTAVTLLSRRIFSTFSLAKTCRSM